MATPGYKTIGPDGRETAPFDSDALMSYARQGHIHPTTNVYDPTIGEWIPASQVNALASLNAGMPPAGIPPYVPQGAYAPYPGAGYQYAPPRPAGVPRAVVLVIALVVGLFVSLIGIGAMKFLAAPAAATKQTIMSRDGLYSVSIPDAWTKWDAKDHNLVEYVGSEAGVTVLQLSTETYTPAELDQLTANVVRITEKNLNVTKLYKQPSTVTIAGYKARQFQIDDDGSSSTFRFTDTIIATPDGVYNVNVFWDRSTDDQSPQPAEILSSFHKTTGHGANVTSNP